MATMFEPAASDEDAAGLAYVQAYVSKQAAAGAVPAQILSSFGISAPPPADTAALCQLILAKVHSVQDDELPRALVSAAREGRVDEALQLLAAGAPWDAIDEGGHSAGAYALRDGHEALLEALLDAGSRSVVREADRAASGGGGASAEFGGTHADFLKQRLRFEDDEGRLMDEQDRPVMMSWERPLMEAHAAALCPDDGRPRRVLNIGFGLGLIDGALQRRKPAAHAIVEAHPDVLARMAADGWGATPGVTVLAGTWQEVLPPLCVGGVCI